MIMIIMYDWYSHQRIDTWSGGLVNKRTSGEPPNYRIIKRSGGLGSWRSSGDHPNNCIIEDVQNTEKSTGDLRGPAVIQTPVKNHQLTLM